MEHVRVDDVEVPTTRPTDIGRPISRALGTTDFAMNTVELALGAARETEDIESLLDCSECKERTVHTFAVAEEGDVIGIHDSGCGTETRQPHAA